MILHLLQIFFLCFSVECSYLSGPAISLHFFHVVAASVLPASSTHPSPSNVWGTWWRRGMRHNDLLLNKLKLRLENSNYTQINYTTSNSQCTEYKINFLVPWNLFLVVPGMCGLFLSQCKSQKTYFVPYAPSLSNTSIIHQDYKTNSLFLLHDHPLQWPLPHFLW